MDAAFSIVANADLRRTDLGSFDSHDLGNWNETNAQTGPPIDEENCMPARRKAKSSAKPKARAKSLASKAGGAAKKATRKVKGSAAKLQRGAKKVVSKVGRAAEVTRDVADTVANVADALIKPSKRSGGGGTSKRGAKRGT
jgi:hypothetical protein